MASACARISTVLLVGVAVFVGCASAERRGDELAEHGKFLAAAAAYDEAVKKSPDDRKLVVKREDARRRAVEGLVEDARARRVGGATDAGLDRLEMALGHAHAWGLALDGSGKRALADETTAASAEMQARVEPLVAAARPLAAEEALNRHAHLFDGPELADVGARLQREVGEAGRTACHALLAIAGGPYWKELVVEYCDHFDVDLPAPPLPFNRGGLAVTGALQGSATGHEAVLTRRLGEAFRQTPWFAPGAPDGAPATLGGRFDIGDATEVIPINAAWTERVPYTAFESYQVSRIEYRQEYRSRLVNVPYTTSESYTYSCGYPSHTCSGTRSVSRTRLESRSEFVSVPHTVWETKTRMVTRYRNEPRVFQYQATRHVASYQANVDVRVTLPSPAEPLVIDWQLAAQDRFTGWEHGVTFEPADVWPTTPNFPTGTAWLGAALDAHVDELTQRLDDAWTSSFCARAGDTLDEAARCLFGGARPDWALARLAAVSADDPRSLARFARVHAVGTNDGPPASARD
jgi:hypothetical protein